MIKWHNYCHLCQRIILNFKFGKCPVGLEGIKKHQILVNGDITFMDEKVYHFVSGWSREISLLSLSLGMWLWWTEEQAQSIGLKDTVSASMNRTKIRSSERSKWLVYDLLLLGYLKCVCYYRCCVIVNGQMIQLTMCSHSLLVIGEIGVRKLQSGRALWGRCPSPARHSLPHPLRPDTRLHSQGFSRKKTMLQAQQDSIHDHRHARAVSSLDHAPPFEDSSTNQNLMMCSLTEPTLWSKPSWTHKALLSANKIFYSC